MKRVAARAVAAAAGLVTMAGILYNRPTPDSASSSLLIGPTTSQVHGVSSLSPSPTAAERAERAAEQGRPHRPTVYVVTPTYNRLEQIPELTRLAQTLLLVPRLHWLVAEDAATTNQQVLDYLRHTGLSYTYLLTPMPLQYRRSKSGSLPKGVANRNAAMNWLRRHATEGVMYMADDDNTYDIRIFEEMRHTRKVSMFPVGLVTEAGLSTPIVREGRWVGWYDGWIADRKFPVDMAGFAVSISFLQSVPGATMPYQPGYEETGFLSSLNISVNDIEFLADNCTKIYVWHTKTYKNIGSSRKILDPKYDGTNLRHLQQVMTLKNK